MSGAEREPGAAQVSAVLVHYRTPRLAAEAAEAVRADCDRAGLAWEVVLVDNGDDPEDRAQLEELAARLPARLVVPGENLGYAGGLRAGVEASRGEVLLLMNPDVLVRPGCVGALVEALRRGASAAGPRFTWDRQGRILLPPAEERTRRQELLGRLARLAPHGPAEGGVARVYRRRWRRHARRSWQATGAVATEALSGALLAVRRDAWQTIGGFDEGYRLYFEETDWLRRLVRAGAEAVHVPSAHAVHLYDRSASTEPRSAGWFAASRRRFERRWYGAPFAGLLALLDRLSAATGSAAPPERLPDPGPSRSRTGPPFAEAPLGGLREPLWVEISPSPLGAPAAAERVGPAAAVRSWRLPEEIEQRLPPGRFRLQVVGADETEGPCRWLTL